MNIKIIVLFFLLNRTDTMNIFVIAVLSISTCRGDKFGSPNSGITFKPMGLLEYSGENYYILADVDVEGLRAAVAPIKRSIEIINTNLVENFELFNALKPNRKVNPVALEERIEDDRKNVTYITHNVDYATTALTVSLQEHIRYIAKDLLQRQNELENYLMTLGHHITGGEENKIHRAKRAVCDGCGSLISYILGLMTNDELRTTNEALERL